MCQWKRDMPRLPVLATLLLSAMTGIAQTAGPPKEIKLGTLYASSGQFARLSLPLFHGLKLWVDEKNSEREGGVYVQALGKKIPLKLKAYDDNSNAVTAAKLYNQLITRDAVDLLVADYGPVLTAAALSIARDHQRLLIDQTGLSEAFFKPDNPYVVLIDEPIYRVWPTPLVEFLIQKGGDLGIKRVAILYSTSGFTATQASSVREFIERSNSGMEIVFEQSVPTNTSTYATLLSSIHAANADAVLEFGYEANDFAFLRDVAASGAKFKLLFCIYPAVDAALFERIVGNQALAYVFGYMNAAHVVPGRLHHDSPTLHCFDFAKAADDAPSSDNP
jgi:branched-chain amino acid transport system substrate-binding protein